MEIYLDQSTFGVIYFSLGTNVRSADLSSSTINTILQTFAELPYDVLWKFEGSLLEKPSNVKTFNWLPQRAILRKQLLIYY